MRERITFRRFSAIRVCVVVVFLSLAFCMTIAWCETVAGSKPPDTVSRKVAPGLLRPYCGLFCLFSAARLLETPCEIEDFLDWRYVTAAGSTLGNLNKAAREKGLYSETVARYSIADIRALSVLAIMHVTKKDGIRKYDHFILLLKAGEHYAWIFDPPEGAKWVPIDDLTQRWDGSCLLISREPMSRISIVCRSYLRFLFMAGLVIGGTLICRRFLRRMEIGRNLPRRQFFRASAIQLLVLTACVVFVSLFWNMFSPRSLFALSGETRHVQASHGELFVDRVSVGKAKRIISQQHPIIVDARQTRDYLARHIEAAVSVPVDSSDAEKEKALLSLDRARTVIVYGRDKKCRFASEVGSFIKSQGFERTFTMNGGWKAWTK